MSLAEILLRDARNGAAAWRALPDLDARLAALIAGCRVTWPGIQAPIDGFVRHLAERLSDDAAALQTVHAPDLYLAWGCAVGDGAALAAFEREFLSQVPLFVGRRGLGAALVDELQHTVRVRLLVSQGAAPPRIAGYTGRGPLGGWLRMVTARALVDLRRGGSDAPEGDVGDAVEARLLDPELALLRRESSVAFEEALAAALGALTEREATMLKLHFVEGLSATTIARLQGLGERTARRWLAETRAKVLEATRRHLVDRLSLTGDALGRLFLLVESELDVSIRRLLARPER